MSTMHKDPLLAVTRVLLSLFMILFGIGLVALVAVLVVLPFPFAQNHIVELDLADGVSSWRFAGRIAVMALFIAIVLTTGFLFTLLLRRIVDTVSAGDPFSPVNARRLQLMGYCTLVLTIGAMLQPFRAAWVNELLLRSDRVEIYSFSADGLLLALILLILGRVLHHGAAMREDLEGTV